jgi:hypothetical protein
VIVLKQLDLATPALTPAFKSCKLLAVGSLRLKLFLRGADYDLEMLS